MKLSKEIISYINEVSKKRAIDFMDWYFSSETNIRIVSDAYDEWRKQEEQS